METVWFCLFLAAIIECIILLVWNIKLCKKLEETQISYEEWMNTAFKTNAEVIKLKSLLSRVGVVRNARGQFERVK